MRRAGFTILEMLACVVVMAIVLVFIAPAIWKVWESSSLAISTENIRSLAAGGAQYLADNDQHFWKYRESGASITDENGDVIKGTRYWFGFESTGSASSGEGNRSFDPSQGPLAGYVPKGIHPDPSFAAHASAFKPKFKSGYLGIGYNVVLGGGWSPSSKTQTLSYWKLSNPARVVVFATSAQVNTFQAPASSSHPMLEEFYGFDQRERTIHFRHGKLAMVGYADGSSGFLPLDESTRDSRLEGVNIGRFAPVGSYEYLK
jgi:prepilin-type N-terminal cleavage/methylation domain-containing protein